MLRTLLGLSVLLSSMSACKYDKEGVYLARIPVPPDPSGDTTITENITDSDPPDFVTTTDSPWIFEEQATQSDALVFVQIFEDKGGNIIFQIADNIYLGTSDGGVITVTWENTNDSSESATNVDAEYSYKENDNSKATNTITLTKNKETKGYTANWQSSSTTVFRAEETDEWLTPEGPYSGDINTWIFTYLDGTGSNSPDQVDCDSEPCFIDVNSTCNNAFNFELIETDLDPEAYEGVETAGQPNGLF